MTSDNIYYFIIFTLFNFIVFLLFYVSAYFFERRIRKGNKRVRVSPSLGFFLHFKKVYGERKLFSSRTGVGCELFALVYFIAGEIINSAIALLTGNWILACRVSVVGAGACVIGFLAVSIVAGGQIRRAEAEREKIRRENDEPKEIIGINETAKLINAYRNEKAIEEVSRDTVSEGVTQSHEKIADIAEGMDEIKKRQDNPLEPHR